MTKTENANKIEKYGVVELTEASFGEFEDMREGHAARIKAEKVDEKYGSAEVRGTEYEMAVIYEDGSMSTFGSMSSKAMDEWDEQLEEITEK